jgi:hypothetical protein
MRHPGLCVAIALSAAVATGALSACQAGPSPGTSAPAAEATSAAATEATPSPASETPAPAGPDSSRPGQAATTLTPLVAPIKGTAAIGYLKAVTKVEKEMVVTTIRVKNLATGAIAGLKVEEFWWDKAGGPVGGSVDQLKKPLMPGEAATFTLRTPKNPRMFSNNYRFSHANGQINAKLLDSLD